MERKVVTGVSRFGRLRKLSTKLLDLPDAKQYTSHETMVDPFAELKPELFNMQETLADEETDSSSSTGKKSASWESLNTKSNTNKKIFKKKKVMSTTLLNNIECEH